MAQDVPIAPSPENIRRALEMHKTMVAAGDGIRQTAMDAARWVADCAHELDKQLGSNGAASR